MFNGWLPSSKIEKLQLPSGSSCFMGLIPKPWCALVSATDELGEYFGQEHAHKDLSDSPRGHLYTYTGRLHTEYAMIKISHNTLLYAQISSRHNFGHCPDKVSTPGLVHNVCRLIAKIHCIHSQFCMVENKNSIRHFLLSTPHAVTGFFNPSFI